MPAGTNAANVVLLVYNTAAMSFQQSSLATLIGLTQNNVTNISVANSPYTPLVTDSLIFVDTAGGPIEIDLAAAATRSGLGLSIKDVTGHAAANNITIKPVGGGAPETLDGYTNAAPLVIDANYGGVRLLPSTLKYVVIP
jgi:hypothetical protein